MAPVYADHPFELIPTPMAQLAKGEEPDMFVRLSTEMACVHNMLLRGLNSIHLQARHIAPPEQKDFLHYTQQWCAVLQSHHAGEETSLFPTIEARTGQPGIMAGNVAQHDAFEGGVDEFTKYVAACLAGREEYSGGKVVELIDAFGPVLREHLADEIPTLVGLRDDYGEELAGLGEEFSKSGGKHMAEVGLTRGAVWCLVVHDCGFEGGLHRGFPPAPAVVLFLLRWVAYWLHTDWWRFAPCDRFGRLRGLYAVGQ